MKKLLVSLAIATAIMSAPAQAGNKTGYIIGGVLGGLLLGEIISDHHHAHAAPAPVYVAPRQPQFVQRCWDEPRSRWNSYWHGYETYYVTRCEWVQNY